MTLGCGAIAGNITSDNVGPLHLINIKRIAYHVRDAESAFDSPEAKAYFAGQPIPGAAPEAPALAMSSLSSAGTGSARISDAVGRYLEQRGISGPARPPAGGAAVARTMNANPAASVVDQFLSRRRTRPVAAQASAPSRPAAAVATPEASPAPPAPPVVVVPFVSEDEVRQAILKERKIYIDSETIVTPAARDLGDARGILVRTD